MYFIYRKLFSAFLVLFPLLVLAQRGPGGVSVEIFNWDIPFLEVPAQGPQSSCRLWLKASSLSYLADGDGVDFWIDESLSFNTDSAVVTDSELKPYFRDDPANSMNGYPVVTFEENRFFQLNSSLDINADTITYGMTAFFAFRTFTDVITRQLIYGEGGCERGLSAYIDNGLIYFGAFDLNKDGVDNLGTGGFYNNGRDLDDTPQWGYAYTSAPIQANTTYILAIQYSAPTAGVVHDNNPDFYIHGWLNGQEFSTIDLVSGYLGNNNGANASDSAQGIGTLFRHINPIGLGAVHSAILVHDGAHCGNTGSWPFQGRLAEVCYYKETLNETQIIIVNNYLASKYLSLFLAQDKYAHKQFYGNDVIGIGQQTLSSSNKHLVSQGPNPFEISVSAASLSANNQYLLAGHNANALAWSSNQIPGNATNMRRLERIWRADRTNWTSGNLTFKVDVDDLPTFPTDFEKIVLMVDESSANFPNFALSSTKVLEMSTLDYQTYTLSYDLPDNAFFTIGTVRPEIGFSLLSSSAIEGNPSPGTFAVNAQISLNYSPFPSSPAITADYSFLEGTAVVGDDFLFDSIAQSSGVTIPAGQRTANITFSIVNDLITETPATESLKIILLDDSNTSADLQIGPRDTLNFFIYDNDAPPVVIFDPEADYNVNESLGAKQLFVKRVGNPADLDSTATVKIRLQQAPNQGTASYFTNADFNLQTNEGWETEGGTRVIEVTFLPNDTIQAVLVTIFNDETDEFDETIHFELQPVSGVSLGDSASTQATLHIIDDDPLPVVTFFTDNQQGFSSIGNPIIFVSLDRPSAKDVEVDYNILTSSTASDPTHFGIVNPGTIVFPPDSTLMWPPLIVDGNSGDTQDSRTIDFELSNPVNASLSTNIDHTYTIINYAPFEWRGAAGVGQESDNIIWIDADRLSGNHDSGFNTISNFSPRNINIVQNNAASQATLQSTSNLINGRKTLRFDGINHIYSIQKHPSINQSGSFERKSFFFAIRTGNNVSNGQVIYQQGVNNRGITIYIFQSKLYINVWNTVNDLVNVPWGSGSVGGGRFASSDTIAADTDYIVSCHFDHEAQEKIVIYVNGRKGDRTETQGCGLLYGDNNDVGLGGILGASRFHVGPTQSSGNHFGGYLAEFIKFSDPQMNEIRRTILENYLSAKYGIPLIGPGTAQIFETLFIDATNPALYFGNQVAGIGIGNDSINDIHLDAQGLAELRIRNPNVSSFNKRMVWGHNGVPLNHSWPYSSAVLPSGIFQRSGRVWKVFNPGGLTEVDVLLRFSNLANASAFQAADLKLLMHSNIDPQDFSDATVISGAAALNSGFVVEFPNVTIPNGAYLALASSTNSMLPLPIGLLNFTAKEANGRVHLQWQTASETNNDFFTVERSDPGLQWNEVLKAPAAGNSNTVQHYQGYDHDPFEGWSYYRLKQTDFDGSTTYAAPVAVWIEPHEGQGDVFLFPNPVSGGEVMVRLPVMMQRQAASLVVHDLAGKPLTSAIIPAHTELFGLDVSHLSSGIYFVAVDSGALRDVQKLIVQ